MKVTHVKRVTGFEPVSTVWETAILPLDDTRVATAAASSTSGGIRTLAVRLRGGCSTHELRRHFAATPVRAGGVHSRRRFSCQRAGTVRLTGGNRTLFPGVTSRWLTNRLRPTWSRGTRSRTGITRLSSECSAFELYPWKTMSGFG